MYHPHVTQYPGISVQVQYKLTKEPVCEHSLHKFCTEGMYEDSIRPSISNCQTNPLSILTPASTGCYHLNKVTLSRALYNLTRTELQIRTGRTLANSLCGPCIPLNFVTNKPQTLGPDTLGQSPTQ